MSLCCVSPQPYMKHGAKAPWRSRQHPAVLPNHTPGKQPPQRQAKDWSSSPVPQNHPRGRSGPGNWGLKQQSLIWVLGVLVNPLLHAHISTGFAGVGLGAAERFVPLQIIPLEGQDLGDGGARMWQCMAQGWEGGGEWMQCWHSRGTAGCSGGQQCCQRQRLGPAKRQAAVWLPAPCRARGFLPLAAALGSSGLRGTVGAPVGWGSPMWVSIPERSPKEGHAAGSTPWAGCAVQPHRHRKPPNGTTVPAVGDAGVEPGGTDAPSGCSSPGKSKVESHGAPPGAPSRSLVFQAVSVAPADPSTGFEPLAPCPHLARRKGRAVAGLCCREPIPASMGLSGTPRAAILLWMPLGQAFHPLYHLAGNKPV